MHFPVSFGTLSCPRTEVPPGLEIPLYLIFKTLTTGF